MAQNAPHLTVPLDCPHCGRDIDFNAHGVFSIRVYVEENETPIDIVKGKDSFAAALENLNTRRQIEAFSVGCCNRCDEPILLRYVVDEDLFSTFQDPDSWKKYNGTEFLENMHNLRTIPDGEFDELSQHLTSELHEIWLHTLKGLKRGDPASALVSQCRSLLDVSLKILGEKKGGRKARIANLVKSGVLTKDLGDWGDFLWDDGIDAVHDIKATQEAAEQHIEFLKLFFRVVFVLPAEVTERRNNINPSQP